MEMFSHSGNASFSRAAKRADPNGGSAASMVAVFGRCRRSASSSTPVAPEEHAGVPEEAAGCYVASRLGGIGLLVETPHRHGGGVAGFGAAGELDVPVAGLGPARLDRHGHQVAGCRALEGRLHDPAVCTGFADHVVGGEDAHDRLRVERVQNMRRQPDGGRGVALRGFGQNLLRRHGRELPDDDVAQVVVGQHPDALRRNHGRQAVHGGLDQGPFSHHVQHLLGGALPAPRPEPRAAAPGENQPVMMCVHSVQWIAVDQVEGPLPACLGRKMRRQVDQVVIEIDGSANWSVGASYDQ